MLRIHFTGDDLARTRIASSADPLWELILCLHRLTSRRGRFAFADWRVQVRAQLAQQHLARAARRLSALAPCGTYFPDFLTPAEAGSGLEPGIDAVLATPRRRIRQELEKLNSRYGTPAWAWPLSDGDREARGLLNNSLRSTHRAALAPYWPRIQARVDADRAIRTRALLSGGIEGMLAGFGSGTTWHPPVLAIDHLSDRDVYLDGRGLLLIPSYFNCGPPVPLANPDLPQVIVYSLEHDPRWLDNAPGAASVSHLSRLLGSTRSAILHATTTGCSTSELARRAGVSPATASQHATVLRDAGLITSRRHANQVIHTSTPLGTALLTAAKGREYDR